MGLRGARVTVLCGLTALFAATANLFPEVNAVRAAVTPTVVLSNSAPGASTAVTFSYTLSAAVGSSSPLLSLTRPAGYPAFTAANSVAVVSAVSVNGTPFGVADWLGATTVTANSILVPVKASTTFAVGWNVELTVVAGHVVNPAAGTYSWDWTAGGGGGAGSFSADATVASASTTVPGTASPTTIASTGSTSQSQSAATTLPPAEVIGEDGDVRPTADEDIVDLIQVKLTPESNGARVGGSVRIRPEPGGPALQLLGVGARPVDDTASSASVHKQTTVIASPELNVTVNYSGADYNNPKLWAEEGFGDECWKIDFSAGGTYVYPLPTPTQSSGTSREGWTYSTIIVKAGSVTDPSYQTNTLFRNVPVGWGVFADVNANGISDPGGRTGDKSISHVIFCGRKPSSSTSTTSAGAQTTVQGSATTTAGNSTTSAAPTTAPATSTTQSSPQSTSGTTGPTTVAPTTVSPTTASPTTTVPEIEIEIDEIVDPKSSTTTSGSGSSTSSPASATSTTSVPPGSASTTSVATSSTATTAASTSTTTTTTAVSSTSTGPAGSSSTTTTSTVVASVYDQKWDPWKVQKKNLTATEVAKRKACGSNSSYEAAIASVRLLVSRGTSQEVVDMELCLNDFTLIRSNLPASAYVSKFDAFGAGFGQVWTAFAMIIVGFSILAVRSRRLGDSPLA